MAFPYETRRHTRNPKPRPVPYHLQKPLKEWLQQGVEEDIFERVPEDEPISGVPHW